MSQEHAFQNATTEDAPLSVTLIPAPPSRAKIVITAMVITGEAAGKITLSFSATNQKVFDFSAAGSLAVGVMRWEGDPATALSVTLAAAGDVSVDYVFEAA